ncbi:protease pro-enzyme activation domain-containing protein [Curtobacterium sp. ISL-83]|uniref:S53 family peptidase n=1 Tax=Curtobacterium sp. ISL-83 TaxID=2819145 RepID=UPI001BE816B7|nr:S53 family peptidase [Curtobacterium sp. ISL-83]MBT2502046.1 S8/S53 family peptidase [Curtobacterium sp. ISL-83]
MTDTSNDPRLVPLAGSERLPAPGARDATPLPADTVIPVTVVVRRAQPVGSRDGGAPMDPETFAREHGATDADLALVRTTLEGLGLTVLEADAATRHVRVEGTAAQMSRAFGTELESVTSDAPTGGTAQHRHRSGGLSVPADLDGVVVAVLGLDDRPQARTQFRSVPEAAVSTSYTPIQLGEAYAFPAGTDGSGQTVAIIELGGGYEQADLDTYFSTLGVGSPSVTAVGVDGAENVPGGDPQGADGEVMLDIEVVGALAPAASIVVYFAPNTDAGFVDAVARAAHATPTPTSMSISWGQSEDAWTAQARTALDDAVVDAVTLGVTVTAAAGDGGSSDGATDGRPHVDFPAASPHVLACGGTRLEASGATIRSETVWDDGASGGATGGGVSDTFPRPSWQQGVAVPTGTGTGATGGRGVPDVAADADPQTGYQVVVDGTRTVIGGTSAVAPLWAALIARIVQSTGRPLGLAQPALYAAAHTFHDVTSGSNGAYDAAPGWDACTGLGSPDGTALLAALTASGAPRTA